jgi:ADP-heptose:LPS heptosyltransferase
MPFNDLAALFAVPGIHFYSLQKGFGSEQLDESPHAASVEDIAARLDAGADRFIESAAAIMHLDLVITVDTAIAHLAGALGRPVWLLLSPNAEWRWFRDTEDSPWYPTMRLFRRRTSETWSALLERVSRQLLDVTSNGRKLHPSSR